MIRAVQLEGNNAFELHCLFITGSNAQGCMVVVVGVFGNITGKLTKSSGLCTTEVLNTVHSLSSYYEVFGFDIESDGSVGTLAVPGVLMTNVSTVAPCTANPPPSGFAICLRINAIIQCIMQIQLFLCG